jgi:hypothetical protein
MAEIFAHTRLAASRAATFGASHISAPETAAILERALPA